MNSEEPELPVAAVICQDKNEPEGKKFSYIDVENKRNSEWHKIEDELVRKSDAEDAIQQARQAERREILNKIENRINELNEHKKPAVSDAHAKGNALAHDVSLELRGSISELQKFRDDLQDGENQ